MRPTVVETLNVWGFYTEKNCLCSTQLLNSLTNPIPDRTVTMHEKFQPLQGEKDK